MAYAGRTRAPQASIVANFLLPRATRTSRRVSQKMATLMLLFTGRTRYALTGRPRDSQAAIAFYAAIAEILLSATDATVTSPTSGADVLASVTGGV